MAVVPERLMASVLGVKEREQLVDFGWWVVAPALSTMPALKTAEAYTRTKLCLEIKQAKDLIFLRAKFDLELFIVLAVGPHLKDHAMYVALPALLLLLLPNLGLWYDALLGGRRRRTEIGFG